MRDSKGRITGYWLPKFARKSSVSFDWLVWLCKETPVWNPFGALGSRHRYEMVELAISAPSPRSCPDFCTQYPLPTVNARLRRCELPFNWQRNQYSNPKAPGRIPAVPLTFPEEHPKNASPLAGSSLLKDSFFRPRGMGKVVNQDRK